MALLPPRSIASGTRRGSTVDQLVDADADNLTSDRTLLSFYAQLRQLEGMAGEGGSRAKQARKNIHLMRQLILNRKALIGCPLTPEEMSWEVEADVPGGPADGAAGAGLGDAEDKARANAYMTPKRKRTGGIFGTPLRTPKSAKRIRRSMTNVCPTTPQKDF
mmetsp:Transcript_17343/g.48774  ORF Transcript_17343/g.48774 Transcript_17343/m.48774 type:complete len:162 (+) Transcript_17343:2-487(+)